MLHHSRNKLRGSLADIEAVYGADLLLGKMALSDNYFSNYNLDYHGWAKFAHNGYAYYIATHSNNPKFFELILEQMLK